MTTSLSDECPTCGQTRKWHQENSPRHSFGGPLAVTPEKPTVKASPWPFDPVLRQVLISKGLITPEDLTEAENHIRAVTAQFGGVSNDAGATTGRS